MFGRLAASTICTLALLHGAAFAQQAGGSDQSSSSAGQSAISLPQQIQQKIKSQGFTDVKVVPESFLVTAKDKDGDPVTMIIGPHSLVMFSVTAAGEGAVEHRSSSGANAPSIRTAPPMSSAPPASSTTPPSSIAPPMAR